MPITPRVDIKATLANLKLRRKRRSVGVSQCDSSSAMAALLANYLRRQSLFLQFSEICNVRLLSSDKKSRPSRPKSQSFEERRRLQKGASKQTGAIPTSELLKDFLQSPHVEPVPPQTTQRSKSKTELEPTATTHPETGRYARPVPENVIKSKDLLKDFLDAKGRPDRRLVRQRPSTKGSVVEENFRSRHTEALPLPEQLSIFDELPFPGNETPAVEAGEAVYNNAVFDEVEALEASTYRAKNTTNKFEELMQWTLDGKLWRYPIDNEQDWDTEHDTGFEDHVFLNRFLDRTSKKPAPLAAFMELVCTGLAQNPYLDSNQKRKHLEWFEGYFKTKAGQIEAAVLEEKRLAELEAKAKATT
ncbi:structural constituent of ribosome [Sparganum proliferum]